MVHYHLSSLSASHDETKEKVHTHMAFILRCTLTLIMPSLSLTFLVDFHDLTDRISCKHNSTRCHTARDP
jgi:hypothetical protein